MTVRILHGDCRQVLRELPDASVHCCVTSPPYFGLRDYGVEGQIGLEPTPAEYVAQMVEVFREVRRVLRDDGVCWLNLGDSYCTVPHGPKGANAVDPKYANDGARVRHGDAANRRPMQGLKHKDLIGIPWRVAFALQADGWYLRQEIIWHKPNPMPESVRDRCTKAHESVFLLAKSERYGFDADAIAEPAETFGRQGRGDAFQPKAQAIALTGMRNDPGLKDDFSRETRNKRSVWTIATKPFAEAHFATMAPELAETCIKAGCPVGGVVLDPFGGAGTTGLVADQLQRDAILIELNPAYRQIAERRITGDAPLFAEVTP